MIETDNDFIHETFEITNISKNNNKFSIDFETKNEVVNQLTSEQIKAEFENFSRFLKLVKEKDKQDEKRFKI